MIRMTDRNGHHVEPRMLQHLLQRGILRHILQLFRNILHQTLGIVIRTGDQFEFVRHSPDLLRMVPADSPDSDDSYLQFLHDLPNSFC